MPNLTGIYYDGDYTRAVAIGAPRYVYPFRQNGDRASAYFEQDYWQLLDNWTPQEFATRHETLPDFYLIAESEPKRGLGNLWQFTRTFSRIPAQQSVTSTISITRPALTLGVAVNMTLVTGSGTGTNNGANYTYLNYAWDIVNHRVYGPITATTSAASGGDCTLTWTAHGLAGTERIIVYANYASTASWYLFSSAQYTVATANTLTLTGWSAFTTGATFAGEYLRDYTSGIAVPRCKVVSDFYLPGVSTGITTANDITIPTDLLNDTAFLAAVVANPTGYVSYQLKTLEQWMGSPLWRRDTIQLNFADL